MEMDYEFTQAEVRDIADVFGKSGDSSGKDVADKRAVFWRTSFSPFIDYPASEAQDTSSSARVLIVSALEGIRGSITSQIAVQLSNTALEETAIEVCENAASGEHDHPLATEIVRRSLKRANEEVYRYATKMQAGGKIAARGFLAAYDGGRLTAACVGAFESFLLRDGKLSSLFDIKQSPNEKAGVLERFIGANDQLLVDLATVRVQENDVFILTSFAPGDELTEVVKDILSQNAEELSSVSEAIVKKGAFLSAIREESGKSSVEKNAFVAIVRVGKLAIPLTEMLVDEEGV